MNKQASKQATDLGLFGERGAVAVGDGGVVDERVDRSPEVSLDQLSQPGHTLRRRDVQLREPATHVKHIQPRSFVSTFNSHCQTLHPMLFLFMYRISSNTGRGL